MSSETKILESGSHVEILTKTFGGVSYKIHSYIYKPDCEDCKSFSNTSHIIETPNSLMLVDVQYNSYGSYDFLQYVISLQKHLALLLLSNTFPTYYLGLLYFSTAPIYTTESIKNTITKNIEKDFNERVEILNRVTVEKNLYQFDVSDQSENVLKMKELVNNIKIINVGMFNVDSLSGFIHEFKSDFGDSLIIEFKDIKVLIVQDLVTNKYHPFLKSDINNQNKLLEEYYDKYSDYNVLVGHGYPGDSELFKNMSTYILEAGRAICCIRKRNYRQYLKSIEYKNKMVEYFAKYKGEDIIDRYSQNVF